MALRKCITLENGIVVHYHRIAMIKIDVNQSITLLVISNLNEEGRKYEKEYELGKIEQPTFPYTQSQYISMNYDEQLLQGNVIDNAYVWLKHQPKFIGAEDV